MKKRDLATLAMIGVSAGLIAGGCQQNSKSNNPGNHNGNGRNNGSHAAQTNSDMNAFRASLSPEAQKKFDQLDTQHKQMAVEMANQSCNGKNKCSGMGGCATAENACAGQNGCKGEGGPPVKDPNKAVEAQHKNQMKENGNGK